MRLPRPPATRYHQQNWHHVWKDVLDISIGLAQIFKFPYHTYDCEMDGHQDGLVIVYHIILEPHKSDIGVAFFHSPASLHSSSHPWNRRPLPGEIRPRKNSGFRAYYSSTSRTGCRRMLRLGHVSYPRACLPNQERICTVQQVYARGEDCGFLRWNSDAKRCRDFGQQRHASSYYCWDPRANECLGTRQETSTGQH